MTLTGYLSRLLLGRIVAVMLALTALALMIEMLEAIRHVLGDTRGLGTVVTYLILRVPLVLDRLLPVAVLIGTATAFATLARNNEMAVLRAAGLSPLGFLRALLPVALICGTANYAMTNHGAPAADRYFAAWWQGLMAEDAEQSGKDRPSWLRVGNEIVSVGRIDDSGRGLDEITRYGRDDKGRLSYVSRAGSASFDGTAWRLDGERTDRSDGRPQAPDGVWRDGPSVENMHQLTLPLTRISSEMARRVLQGHWSGRDSTAHYRLAIHRGQVALAIPMVMLLLAVPALHGMRRAGSLVKGMAVSLGMGFAFLVVNGLFLSMGEAAVVPAVLAAWAGPLSFLFLGLTLWLHFEEGG